MGGLEDNVKDTEQGGGEAAGIRIFFFKAIVQSVLLLYAETWVVTPHIERVLGGFQDQVARRLTMRMPHQRYERRQEYTSTEEAKEEAGFDQMETYIW